MPVESLERFRSTKTRRIKSARLYRACFVRPSSRPPTATTDITSTNKLSVSPIGFWFDLKSGLIFWSISRPPNVEQTGESGVSQSHAHVKRDQAQVHAHAQELHIARLLHLRVDIDSKLWQPFAPAADVFDYDEQSDDH